MEKKYHEIEVETFVQATEDEEKVIEAVSNIIGIGIPEDLEIVETEGSHGNPIGMVSYSFRRKRDIEGILEGFRGKDFMKEALSQVEERLDESLTFHMRLDKQMAYLGELRLWESGEAVKIRMKPATFPASREEAVRILMQLME
ncbi:MAG: RNA-binding domain-containing protein [Thermoplasmatota archaeon]